MKKEKFREYRILKIAKGDKIYWRPQYKDGKDWIDLYILVVNTDILYPYDADSEASARKRIEEDKELLTWSNKYEIYDEIYVGKVQIV
jgi:hypothetical protein